MGSPFLKLLTRWLVTALGVVIAAKVVDGIRYDSVATLLVVVVLLSFLNATLGRVLMFFTLPFIILSAGLGIIVINALVFMFVSVIVPGFTVDGFWPACWGSLIVSLTSLFLSAFLRPGRSGRPPRQEPPRDSKPRGRGDGDVIDI